MNCQPEWIVPSFTEAQICEAILRPLTLELARWLRDPAAQARLQELQSRDLGDHALLPLLTELREQYTPAEAAALVDQARLRQQAVSKFGTAAWQMLFTDEALQQASGQPIARYRARRYVPFEQVADLGCGIGGDALALSERVSALLAIDLDPVRLCLAEHNLAVAGGAATVQVAASDWTAQPLPPTVGAAFADPARRVGERRLFSLHQIEPPLSAILALQARLPALGVKVMPGVADEEIPAQAEVEFISEGGSCKEAVLWFGALREGVARRATLLGAGEIHSLDSAAATQPLAVEAPRAYLWEPDAAIIRATLVAQLATRLGASQIDAQIAYLSSDHYAPSPLARAWPILDHAPFNLKAMKRWLRQRGAQVLAVKKRGSPIEPEQFRRRLPSDPQGEPTTIFITRHLDRPWMLFCGEEETR